MVNELGLAPDPKSDEDETDAEDESVTTDADEDFPTRTGGSFIGCSSSTVWA